MRSNIYPKKKKKKKHPAYAQKALSIINMLKLNAHIKYIVFLWMTTKYSEIKKYNIIF